MVKLVVCDIDGTLLSKNSERIDEDTVLALEALHKAGKIICLASGRSYYSMRKIADSLSFADDVYYICNDGAICIYKQKILYHKQLSTENILKFSRNPEYSDLPIMYYSDTFSYVTGTTPEFLKKLEDDYTDKLDPISGVYDIKAPIYKIGIYGFDKCPKAFLPHPFDLRICYNSAPWLEYTSRFANKGLAVSDLQMRLYLSKFDTAAIGDGDNDVEMFSKAKYTYSKRGASEALDAVSLEKFDMVSEVLEKLLYL